MLRLEEFKFKSLGTFFIIRVNKSKILLTLHLLNCFLYTITRDTPKKRGSVNNDVMYFFFLPVGAAEGRCYKLNAVNYEDEEEHKPEATKGEQVVCFLYGKICRFLLNNLSDPNKTSKWGSDSTKKTKCKYYNDCEQYNTLLNRACCC